MWSHLELSEDRKVASAVSPGGTRAKVKNTFGLPSGISCPGKTPTCAKDCYAIRSERMYTSLQRKLARNWEALQGRTVAEMTNMIGNMIAEFRAVSINRGAELIFRIHFDGDFFSREYTQAWAAVIAAYPDVQFWCYTRSFEFVDELVHLPNLGLYLSVDRDNLPAAKVVRQRFPALRWAWLGRTFAEGTEVLKAERGRPGGACPENSGAIPLISPAGSACARCRLCLTGKADIRFSITRR